jgi:hypothetical protein
MANYYFLLNSLPTLALRSGAEITFEDLKELLEMNLTKDDLSLAKDFMSYIDLRNIRAFWLKEPLDPRGNLGEKELEEALLVSDFLPSYVFDFLSRYESLKDRLHYFSYLYFQFFAEGMKEKGFLGEYFREEREIRLVMSALRAKLTKRNILPELQFEDPTDPIVMHILAQKDMDEYDPPREYEGLKNLFKEYFQEPKKLALAFLEYRFESIMEKEMGYPPFSIDRILGYMVRLLLVEHWNSLDEEKGSMLLDSIA